MSISVVLKIILAMCTLFTNGIFCLYLLVCEVPQNTVMIIQIYEW